MQRIVIWHLSRCSRHWDRNPIVLIDYPTVFQTRQLRDLSRGTIQGVGGYAPITIGIPTVGGDYQH